MKYGLDHPLRPRVRQLRREGRTIKEIMHELGIGSYACRALASGERLKPLSRQILERRFGVIKRGILPVSVLDWAVRRGKKDPVAFVISHLEELAKRDRDQL